MTPEEYRAVERAAGFLRRAARVEHATGDELDTAYALSPEMERDGPVCEYCDAAELAVLALHALGQPLTVPPATDTTATTPTGDR